MPGSTFGSFTLEASPGLTDYLVGYRTAVSGGERRTTNQSLVNLFAANLTDIRSPALSDLTLGTGTFGTSITLASATGIPTFATNVVFQGTSLSVPDAFNISSAGSVAITAGGSNKSVTVSPSGTGDFVINENGGTPPTAIFRGVQMIGAAATQSGFNGRTFAERGRIGSYRANGTISVPSAVSANDNLLTIYGGGYGATGYLSARPGFDIQAKEAWTDSAAGSALNFNIVLSGTLTGYGIATFTENGILQVGGGSKTRANFGSVDGNVFNVLNTTITDSASSGTVAAAVSSSFRVPVFGATTATVFTDAANVRIAGDPTFTGNASATNSYGLWNVGKTRLDGAVVLPSTNTSGIQLYNTADQVTNYERLEMLWTGGTTGVLRTIAGGSGTLRTLSLQTGAITLNLRSTGSAAGLIQFGGAVSSIAGAVNYNFSGAGSSATSGTNVGLSLTPTYNQASGTAANTDLLVNRTQTAIGSGAQRLASFQVASVAQFEVDNVGRFACGAATLSDSTAAMHPAGTTAISSLRIPHGAAPSSPVNGDMWTTTAGLFIRINGATVGPLS